MDKTRKALSILVSSILSSATYGNVFALDSTMVKSIWDSFQNAIPQQMEKELNLSLRNFILDPEHNVFLLGNIPSNLVEKFFTGKTDNNKRRFAILNMDVGSDSLSIKNYEAVLTNTTAPRIVLATDVTCADAKRLAKILEISKNDKNTLVYIETSRRKYSCGKTNCENCKRVRDLFDSFKNTGALSTLYFQEISKDFYSQWITKLSETWKKLYEEKKLDVSINLKDSDIETISTLFEGHQVGEVQELIIRAFINAESRDSKLSLVDFIKLDLNDEKAFGHSVVSVPNAADQRVAAYHECGHAFVAHHEGFSVRCLLARKGGDGLTLSTCVKNEKCLSVLQMISWVKMFMAGKIAEDLISGSGGGTSGCESDFEKVRSLLNKIVVTKDPSLDYQEKEKEDAVLHLYRKLYDETVNFLKEHALVVKKLGDRLLEKEFVDDMKILDREEFLSNLDEVNKEQKEEDDLMGRLNKAIENHKPDPKLVQYIEDYYKKAPETRQS